MKYLAKTMRRKSAERRETEAERRKKTSEIRARALREAKAAQAQRLLKAKLELEKFAAHQAKLRKEVNDAIRLILIAALDGENQVVLSVKSEEPIVALMDRGFRTWAVLDLPPSLKTRLAIDKVLSSGKARLKKFFDKETIRNETLDVWSARIPIFGDGLPCALENFFSDPTEFEGVKSVRKLRLWHLNHQIEEAVEALRGRDEPRKTLHALRMEVINPIVNSLDAICRAAPGDILEGDSDSIEGKDLVDTLRMWREDVDANTLIQAVEVTIAWSGKSARPSQEQDAALIAAKLVDQISDREKGRYIRGLFKDIDSLAKSGRAFGEFSYNLEIAHIGRDQLLALLRALGYGANWKRGNRDVVKVSWE